MPGGVASELGAGGVGAIVGAGFLKLAEVWLSKRRTPEELAAAVFAASRDHMNGMRQDFEALREELRLQKETHAREIAELKREAAEEKAACDRRLSEVQGQLRQAQQQIGSLVRQLRDPSATAPGGPLEGAVIELVDGEARVTRPNRKPRRSKP
ncbi:MAG: hypothetical protein ACK4Z5_05435 [Brevundimonas sp.]